MHFFSRCFRKQETSWKHFSQNVLGMARNFIKSQCEIFVDGDESDKTDLIRHRIDTG